MILGALALFATGVAGFAAGKSTSQEAFAVQPGEEHRWLASLAGEYTAKVGGMMGESEGTNRIESALGGLWNVTHFESSMMGQPFTGIEILGFDPVKERFVSVWVDSMNPILTAMEGAYDADTKTLTMRGLSVGMDGEEGEMVNTTTFGDGGMNYTMTIEGTPLMTIDYTRKR
jgi:hypothetical protein